MLVRTLVSFLCALWWLRDWGRCWMCTAGCLTDWGRCYVHFDVWQTEAGVICSLVFDRLRTEVGVIYIYIYTYIQFDVWLRQVLCTLCVFGVWHTEASVIQFDVWLRQVLCTLWCLTDWGRCVWQTGAVCFTDWGMCYVQFGVWQIEAGVMCSLVLDRLRQVSSCLLSNNPWW